MQVLGLDIGGANIKAATADGRSVSMAFAIWQNKGLLATKLREITLLNNEPADIVALTMTAELADCFESKAEGVEFIVRTVEEVFAGSLIRIWLTSGEFAEPDDAIELPQLAAASNWHALATWVGRAVPNGLALLVDVGSTTTDIIPLLDGIPIPEGLTDLARLESGELIYSGVRRTPVCSIVQKVPLLLDDKNGQPELAQEPFIPVAAELFATALDAHLVNGDIAADLQDLDTADGRPATREAAMNRLAHMMCCDRSEISEAQLEHIARYIADKQIAQICSAVHNRLDYLQGLRSNASEDIGLSDSTHPASDGATSTRILISGSGAWLAERSVQAICNMNIGPISNLSSMFVHDVSTCAPAFAVARLAAERCLDDLLPVSPW